MMPTPGIHKGDKEFFEYNLPKKQETTDRYHRSHRLKN
jgi:hypothetical protein